MGKDAVASAEAGERAAHGAAGGHGSASLTEPRGVATDAVGTGQHVCFQTQVDILHLLDFTKETAAGEAPATEHGVTHVLYTSTNCYPGGYSATPSTGTQIQGPVPPEGRRPAPAQRRLQGDGRSQTVPVWCSDHRSCRAAQLSDRALLLNVSVTGDTAVRPAVG